MINLAVIGTNWISEKFVEASLHSKKFKLSAVYSRQLESARGFAVQYQSKNCKFYDDLSAVGRDKTIDAVYIASPNSLHCEQAIMMMKFGKHVICEKPIASNITQAEKMYRSAQFHNVILFEAFKTEFLPNFQLLKNNIASIGKLHNAYITYCQYSSRYQKYLDGENPNTFNPTYSNGSIMDIGFYCVSCAISLFGKPERVQASAKLLDSGVDAHGTIIFEYADFLLTIQHSKVSDSKIPSEIQGEDGVILIDQISECNGFNIQKRGGISEMISVEQGQNSMLYEAIAFAKQIENGVMNPHAVERSLAVSEITTEIRRQTGVLFPADQ